MEVDDELIADVERMESANLEQALSAAQLDRAVQRWIDEEVLVREARRLGLDRDDPVVRARLAKKMAFVLDAQSVAPEPAPGELEALYESSKDEFRLTARITLRQVFVEGTDAASEARAEALLALARSGAEPAELNEAGDRPPGGPVLRRRTPEGLSKRLGAEFASGLESVELDEWHLRKSTLGWHVVRVDGRIAGKQLSFDEARERVLLRWQAARLREASAGAVEELRAQYEVRGWPR